jgi:hypothetical protein
VKLRCSLCGYGYAAGHRRLGDVCGNRTALVQQEIQAPVCWGRLVTLRKYKKFAKDVARRRREARGKRTKSSQIILDTDVERPLDNNQQGGNVRQLQKQEPRDARDPLLLTRRLARRQGPHAP